MNQNNTAVENVVDAQAKARMEAAKKFFSNKTTGFAIGYLTGLRHANKAGHVATQEEIELLQKAAYACGLLQSKKSKNPLVA